MRIISAVQRHQGDWGKQAEFVGTQTIEVK